MFDNKKYHEIKEEVGEDIRIIGVTKRKSADDIKHAVEAGIRLIGESYIQEAEKKYTILKEFFRQNDVRFHMIGHLQSNKAKKAVEIFDCIQTIDSEKKAIIVNQEAEKQGKIMQVMIEINFYDNNKHGAFPEKTDNIIKAIRQLNNLRLIGLMCIPPVGKEEECFAEMAKLKHFYNLPELSMGMSEDYKIAIKNSSTMLRLGRIIFGER